MIPKACSCYSPECSSFCTTVSSQAVNTLGWVSYRYREPHLRCGLKSQAPRRLHSEHGDDAAVDHVAGCSLSQRIRCENSSRLHVDSVSKEWRGSSLLLPTLVVSAEAAIEGGGAVCQAWSKLSCLSRPSTSSLPYTSSSDTTYPLRDSQISERHRQDVGRRGASHHAIQVRHRFVHLQPSLGLSER